MRKVIKYLGIIVVIIVISIVGYKYYEYTSYKLINDNITVELGEKLSNDASDYVTGSQNAIHHTKIDFSDVDIMQVGNYQATLSYQANKQRLTITVVDTTKPVIKLQNDGVVHLVEGEEIRGSEIVSSMDDLAGIKAVTFDEAGMLDEENSNTLDSISLCYDKAGEYVNYVSVEDNNGNVAKQEFKVIVQAKQEETIVNSKTSGTNKQQSVKKQDEESESKDPYNADDFYATLTPGQTWDMGEPTSEGIMENGNTCYGYDFTW